MNGSNYCNCPSCMTSDCPAGIEEERLHAELVLAKHLLRRFVRCDTTGLKDPLVIEAQAFLKDNGGQT